MQYADNPRFADLCILAGRERVPVHAHRVMLCAASAVFRDMLDHAAFAPVGATMEAPLFEPEELRVLLRHAYGGTRDQIGLTADNVVAVDAAADYYALPELRDECAAFLAEALDATNAVHVLAQLPRGSRLRSTVLDRLRWMDAAAVDDLDAMEQDDVDAVLGSVSMPSRVRFSWIRRWCAGRDVPGAVLSRLLGRVSLGETYGTDRQQVREFLRERGLTADVLKDRGECPDERVVHALPPPPPRYYHGGTGPPHYYHGATGGMGM